MSNSPAGVQAPCSQIERIIKPYLTDLDGSSVRRALPDRQRRMVGPWIFFDHVGPVTFPAGKGVNVRPHPHINLATVTYLFEGEILHRDSLGYEQPIRPGDINLMVAGRGITHSERETHAVRNRQHRFHGLQLWLALPEADEEMAPAFFHYSSDEIPGARIEGAAVRVLMGSAFGLSSTVRTFADTLYVEASLEAGQRLRLPHAQERAVYLVDGALSVQGQAINALEMAVMTAGADAVTLVAEKKSQVVIIGGETLTPRSIYWNFVSSRKERIETAKSDWREGRFPKVVGDEEEFIPLPDD